MANMCLAQQEGLIPYRQGNVWGFSNDEKKMKITPKYDNAFPFSNGRAAVKMHGKWGFIDNDGEEVIPARYDTVLPFFNGFAAVQFNGRWGFITKSGKDRIPPRYENIWSYNDEFAVVEVGGKWGAVYEDEEICTPRYDYVSPMINDFMVVLLDSNEGLMNVKGKEVLAPKFDRLGTFIDDIIIVEVNDKCGVFRYDGTEVIAPVYDRVIPLSQSLMLMSKGKNWGIVRDNNVLMMPLYEYVFTFYGEVGSFIDSSGKWGIINREGQEIVTAHLDNVLCSPSALVIGFRDGEIIYWRDGKRVAGYSFNELEEYVEGLKPKYNGMSWGYVNDDDKEIIPARFERATPFCDEIARVKINGQEGYINREGVQFWDN
jgi:hypothetical protein